MGNKRTFGSKLYFLSYSTGELGMIVELFSRRPFIKILFCHVTIWISRFRITTHFPGNFPKISPKIFGNFSENSYTHHLPPSPTPHITHPHPIPEPVNPLRTLNPFFSIAHRRSKGTFISHRTNISRAIIYMSYNLFLKIR